MESGLRQCMYAYGARIGEIESTTEPRDKQIEAIDTGIGIIFLLAKISIVAFWTTGILPSIRTHRPCSDAVSLRLDKGG